MCINKSTWTKIWITRRRGGMLLEQTLKSCPRAADTIGMILHFTEGQITMDPGRETPKQFFNAASTIECDTALNPNQYVTLSLTKKNYWYSVEDNQHEAFEPRCAIRGRMLIISASGSPHSRIQNMPSVDQSGN